MTHRSHFRDGDFTSGPYGSQSSLAVVLEVNGRLVVVPYWISRSPESFYQLLAEEAVTVLNQTPSAFRQLVQLEASLPSRLDLALRYVIFGGEALDVAALRPWLEHHGEQQPRLINMYGITETTVHVTYRPLTLADCARPGSVIGVPIADLALQVVDSQLNKVPLGVPGELLVGGAGVARGYLDRPELNAQRFVTLRNAAGAVQRMYRSGDLVRLHKSGELEYLGRIDQQVKIRGFRIELGEIEETLRQVAGVRAAVVLAREDKKGDQRLVGYVVSENPDDAEWPARLREHCKRHLPEYMVPAQVLVLDTLPLTENGKIDRRALPAPEQARPQPTGRRTTPGTFIEEELARAFAAVLGLPSVGVDESFFDLGGHSLLVMRVIFRIRETFHVELPMRTLFESPTVATLAQRIAALPLRARGLLVPPIRPGDRGPLRPTSFPQQRLWFLAQLTPHDFAYNEPLILNFVHELDVAALERALTELVRRHEILRTAIIAKGGEPLQRVDAPTALTLPIRDLRSIPATEREAAALQVAQADAQRPFDLTVAPLWRALLVRLSADEYRLFLTFHHAIADGLSIYGVLLYELDVLYRAFIAGQPSPLPELPIQYADFAAWQRAWLTPAVLAPQIDYWLHHLERDAPELVLLTDHPRPAVATARGARQVVRLPAALMRRLKALSSSEGATLFMVLLAAFKALLFRYVEQSAIVVGIVTAGRQRPDLTPLFGFFPNTMALRTAIAADLPFRELLKRVREACLGAYDRSDLPFDQLVDLLRPERKLGENPLFRVAFVLDPPLPEMSGTFTVNFVDIEIQSAKFDLHMELVETPEGLLGHLGYSTELFEPATIDKMVQRYQALLDGIVSAPDRPIAEFDLRTGEEEALLHTWSGAGGDAPAVCIHTLVEAQAAARPQAIAVEQGLLHLSYGELDARASRLAAVLRAHGSGPEQLVGVYIERSLDLVVAILAVLKAGAAFLPLSAALPAARLQFMLGDASVHLILTQERLRTQLPESAVPVLAVDSLRAETRVTAPASDGAASVQPANLAYVIYTSGSTGIPKGVLIEHRGIASTVRAGIAAWQIDKKSRVLQFASLNFDASVWEIFTTLCAGATLCLAPVVPPLGAELARFIGDHAITVITLTPSTLATLPDRHLETVQTVVACGEACSAELVARLGRGRRFLNAYGPTEISVCATVSPCEPQAGEPPIGRPLGRTRIYLLDAQKRPVPIGFIGEIYIGGPGVARGYLNRPELTAERFFPDARAAPTAARMYRSGDLGRYRADGQLLFVGRADNQVKLRGYRIELGEIEAALAEVAGVQQCVVTAHGAAGKEPVLAAYVVRADGAELDDAAVRRQLATRLPGYMIPATTTFLAALPQNASGKVDRRALPAPAAASRAANAASIVPSGELERLIATIWCDVLGVPQVGLQDNFFDLGGHSLRLAHVHARLEDALGRAIPLVELYQFPTVAAIAQRLTTFAPAVEIAAADDIERGKRRREARASQRQRAQKQKEQDE